MGAFIGTDEWQHVSELEWVDDENSDLEWQPGDVVPRRTFITEDKDYRYVSVSKRHDSLHIN